MKTKKILIIALFVIIVLVLGYLIYSIFFKRPNVAPNVNPNQSATSTGTLPQNLEGEARYLELAKQQQELGRLKIDESIKPDDFANGGYTNSKEILSKDIPANELSSYNKGMNYYDPEEQMFFRIMDDGSIQRLSDKKFYAVQSVTWSKNNDRAIIEYPDKTKVLYDFNKDKQVVTFPKEMKDFAFSSSENTIASKWVGQYSDYNYIVSAGYDGTNLKFVEPMGDEERNVKIAWSPDSEILATYRKYIDSERQEVFFINGDGKNLSSLVVEGGGFDGKWNTQGDKILYSVYSSDSQYNPTLWIANGQGDDLGSGKQYLNINTWADKCDFSKTQNNYVYCAVPDSLPDGSGMYPSVASGVPYGIYKIDIYSGYKEKIADPVYGGNRVSIDKLYIGDNDQKIYYTNQLNGYLYNINLAP